MNFKNLILIFILLFSVSCGVKKQPRRGEDIVLQSYIEELKSEPESPKDHKQK